MFQSIRKSICSYLSLQDEFDIKSQKVIYLDTSNGEIDGCCCLFFRRGQDYPFVVAKGARTPAGKAIYEIEFDNLQKLQKCGINAKRQTTPKPLGSWNEEGILVTLQSGLPGPLMKNIPGNILFSPKRIGRSIDSVADWWHNLQKSFGVERTNLTEDVYESHISSPVRLFLQRFPADRKEIRFLTRRYLEQKASFGEWLPLMIRHGDFCTANMVLQPEGIGVLDWEFPLKHQLPLFDLFFFFSSIRFPYSGYRRESNHFRSFTEVFWKDSYINAAMRHCIREMCAAFQIPQGAVPDLFLLSLIQIANMKYDSVLQANGIHEGLDTGDRSSDDKKKPVREFIQRLEKNVPFACIKSGVPESVRFVIRNGFPELT